MKSAQQNIPINILLADDDKEDRFFFNRALKELTIRTQLAIVVDGEKLMAYLSENSHRLPDILFLDLNMPRKNGSECLEEIKGNPKLQRIPVIIYSTSLQDEVADVLYQTGAHYYLKKCNLDELSKFIQRAINLLAENQNQPSRDNFIINLK